MAYVILDPGGEYPAEMVEFLANMGIPGIAVFTSETALHVFRHMFLERLGGAFIDEYLVPQHPSLEALAARMLHDHGPGFEGIIPWDEFKTEWGAHLGEALGIEWNPPEVMRCFRNKYAMKAALRASGRVPINASQVVSDEHEALDFQRRLGKWPVVVKPTEGAGSKAVYFAHDEGELLHRCLEVFQDGNGEVLLEEWVGGREYVVNGIVDAGGDLIVTDVWRYDKREFHGVPNLYYQTYKVSTTEPAFWPLAEYAGEVVSALGLRRAPIHMELKLDVDGPCLIEVGARFGGGRHPVLSSTLHGRSMFELAACHYLAELPVSLTDVDYERYDSQQVRIVSGVQDWPLEAIRDLEGVDEVSQLPSFHDFAELKPPGMPLPVTTDLYTRSYVVYLMHPDAEQVEYDAQQVRHLLRYV